MSLNKFTLLNVILYQNLEFRDKLRVKIPSIATFCNSHL